MKKHIIPNNTIIKNVFILGISGIIAKSFDFIFRAYYSTRLGTEGMGLLSLGFSLHGVMLTFATAGLGVAVSKTASEYMEQGKIKSVIKCMHSSLFGVSALSLIVMALTFIFSGALADRVLGDSRVRVSLCALVPSVLFMGLSYCLKGFYYASRSVLIPASSEFLEQLVKFIAIKIMLDLSLPYGIEYGCAAVFSGISIGELSSCLYLSFIYLMKERSIEKTVRPDEVVRPLEPISRLLSVSIPSMVTSLCCSTLRMKEEVLIISALKRGGMTHSLALSSLGILKGMAMPLLVMPLNLIGSVTSLLVPEISRAGIRSRERLRAKTGRIYKTGLPLGILVGVIFLLFGERITKLVYGNTDAARLVIYLAPLCPVMFADSLSCSILNGLGKQPRMLVFFLLDFCLRFTLIYFTVPMGQMTAFCIMVAASNIFTCILSCVSVERLTSSKGSLFPVRLTKKVKYGNVK